MIIGGFQKTTLLDYPGKIACIIFTQGCNLNCPFCHNSSLIPVETKKDLISEDKIFEYLKKRIGILEAVCITGGEPLMQKDIEEFILGVKSFGYKVKLDTNGSNPELLEKLINNGLVDYVAMDIKNTKSKYEMTSGKKVNFENIKKSIEIIESSKIDYEFRTTLIKEYHNLDDIKEICKMIKKDSKYYLQNFVNSEGVLNKELNGFSSEELKEMKGNIISIYPNVMFRDI